MQFEISFNFNINPFLYHQYSYYIFRRVRRDVSNLINDKKYKVRESQVINCPLIKWRVVPKKLDLKYYITHCLELVKLDGVYVIRVNKRTRLPGSTTTVETLVRILEYGTESIRSYPVIRRVLRYYKENYMNFFVDFMEDSFNS